MTTPDQKREALEAECIRAHNAGHEALCLSDTVVCSIARPDLESLMTIAKLHGASLSPTDEVTVQEFRDVVQEWNDGGFRTHPYLSDWLLEKYHITRRK